MRALLPECGAQWRSSSPDPRYHPGEISARVTEILAFCGKLHRDELRKGILMSPAPDCVAPPVEVEDESDLLARLRAGDERAFGDLVGRWSPAMLRLAQTFVSNRQSAEDAVQDAWLGVLRGLDRFEGRSSLRTWTFTILVNRAKTRGVREARTVPASGLAPEDADEFGPTVDPSRFRGPNDPYPGHWTSAGAPSSWQEPERRAVGKEVFTLVEEALQALPPRQRAVVSMRDVHGLTAEETCMLLELSPQNQRVLLHRARAAVRTVLEGYYRG